MKTVLALVLPGAIVFGVVGGALLFAPASPILGRASQVYPYVAMSAALLLAWRLHRSRLFVATAALFAAFILLSPGLLGTSVLASAIIGTFLPFGFALLSFGQERGFSASRVRLQTLLVLAPVLVGAFFTAGRTDRAIELLTGSGARFAWLGALAIVLVNTVRERRGREAGLAWLTLATVLALSAPAVSIARALWLLAAALVVVVTLVEAAHSMAFNDELTTLPARRALAQALSALRAPYAIAIVDVDHFKSFNDRHGHDVGDQVLRMVAAKLRAVGGGGTAYRSGGEEFTIVLPGLGKKEARPHVEALRAAVENAVFTVRGSNQKLRVTISVGIAAARDADSDVESVIKSADKAMYRAKEAGRNQVVA